MNRTPTLIDRIVYIIVLLALAFFTAFLGFQALANAAPAKPSIVQQHTNVEGVRVIKIRNPGKTGWVYLECENVMSVSPIRIPRGTHTIHLTTNRQYYIVSPPPCVIRRWVVGENAP